MISVRDRALRSQHHEHIMIRDLYGGRCLPMLLGSPGLCMYSRPVVQILLLCAKQSNQAWIVTTPEPRDVDNLRARPGDRACPIEQRYGEGYDVMASLATCSFKYSLCVT